MTTNKQNPVLLNWRCVLLIVLLTIGFKYRSYHPRHLNGPDNFDDNIKASRLHLTTDSKDDQLTQVQQHSHATYIFIKLLNFSIYAYTIKRFFVCP